MVKWLLITAVSGVLAIQVAQTVRPVVLGTFADVAAALEFANRPR